MVAGTQALHSIPYFGDDLPQGEKKNETKGVDFVKQKRAEWEPSKNSAICSVHLKPEDFSTFVRNFAWAKHTFYSLSKQGRFWGHCLSDNSYHGKSDRATTVRAQQEKGDMI